jgi:hypothetical protein
MGLPELLPPLILSPIQFPDSLPSNEKEWTALAIAFDQDGQGSTFIELVELLVDGERLSHQ